MKKRTKIFAGIIAFILIGGLLWFANAFVGNPISKFLANRSAEKYIENEYPDMELELNKATYNFKTGGYSVYVESPTSIDTHFSISISSKGEIIRDSYENVVDKFNTWQRLDSKYRKIVGNIFESEVFPYESEIDYGELKLKEKEQLEGFGPQYGLSLEELEIDKKYDTKELGKKVGHIVLYVEDEQISVKRASEILLNIKDIFDKEDLPFYAIDFTLEEPKTEDNIRNRKSFQVRDFLYNDIYEENLTKRLEKASKDLSDYYEKLDSRENEKQKYNLEKRP